MDWTEKLWRVGRKQGGKRPTRRATRNTLSGGARSGDLKGVTAKVNATVAAPEASCCLWTGGTNPRLVAGTTRHLWGEGQPSCSLPLTVWTVDKGATGRCRIVGAKFARRTQNGSGFSHDVIEAVKLDDRGNADQIVCGDGVTRRGDQSAHDVTGKILFTATDARQRSFADLRVSSIDRRCFARCCKIFVDCHASRLTSGVI